MSEQTDELNPGGLWRCNLCGGLVEEFGAYVCTSCIGLDSAALTQAEVGLSVDAYRPMAPPPEGDHTFPCVRGEVCGGPHCPPDDLRAALDASETP